MQRSRALEGSSQSAQGRGADFTASRPTPLTLVAGAVAGDDLPSVAITVAQALHRPVAIAIPALGAPVIAPPDSLAAPDMAAIVAHAGVVIAGAAGPIPDAIAEAVAVQIADEVVGIVAAAGAAPPELNGATSSVEQHAWLEAAAAAASVTALIREAHGAGPGVGGADSAQALLTELAAAPPDDIPNFLARARRLGHELSSGAVALCGWRAELNGDAPAARVPPPPPTQLAPALMASRHGGRVLAMTALADDGPSAEQLARTLRDEGFSVCLSAPRRDPALLHQALVEAELLVELARRQAGPAVQDDTYRLLIGVLLRNREELEQLRDQTVTPLAVYDARHDTELLATLQAFLTHDGSTTDTAEAMRLHRHTVGYRLSRVHEVSGLSPYESSGRERLSLGIKAHQILEAEARRR
jgi:hypothetical protein